MDADTIIDIRGLRKRFGDLEVLKGIDLSVRRGEVVAIIGRSGSGKSTLLRCINGLEPFQQGTLSVEGLALRPEDAQAMRALRQRVGMIFQSFNLFPHLSAGRNIMLAPGVVKGMRGADGEQRARARLTRLSTHHHQHNTTNKNKHEKQNNPKAATPTATRSSAT